jgi:hypothetical protein
MNTPAVRALQKLSPRVRAAPIHNYLAREPRLSAVAEKLWKERVTTVKDFLLASETLLPGIRMTQANQERIACVLWLFGVKLPFKPPCTKAKSQCDKAKRTRSKPKCP